MSRLTRVKKIILPSILVTLAAIQSFGIDAGRAISYMAEHPEFVRDTVPSPDTTVHAGDSIKPAANDSLLHIIDSSGNIKGKDIEDEFDDDFGELFSEESEEDTVKKISVLDTLTIPAGLDTLDPFKFKYFKAIKDSATRVHTRDSLIEAQDTLELMRLDSLYRKDSAEVAAWVFQKWYNSLDKEGLKKYHFEQKIKKKQKEMDIKMARKDSIQARKDSIRTNTPRILETYVLPDSMLYKRMVTWTHNSDFNTIKTYEMDTSYRYHFNDYPFYKEDVKATYLGTIGTAAQTYDWFRRQTTDGADYFSPYMIYTYTPETLPQYNTKTPYTELAYWGNLFTNTQKAEDNIKILTTQNITPETNILLEYHRFGGAGWLQKEKTDNRTAVAAVNHIGKKYVMHAGYIYNSVKRTENGGIVDNFWIRDTLVDSKEIAVRLSSASNVLKKNTVFLDQSYRIPFNFINTLKEKKAIKEMNVVRDSLAQVLDSAALAEYDEKMQQRLRDSVLANIPETDMDITSAFIGTSTEFSSYRKVYKDALSASDINGSDLYNGNFFLNPTKSSDSLRFMNLENKVFIRLQPWKRDGIVSNLDVGAGDRIRNWYVFEQGSYLRPPTNVVKNSLFAYAGVEGQYKDYLTWNANGKYTFAGYGANDMLVQANATLQFRPFRRARKSPIIINGHFETSLKEPNWYQQHIYTNHYRWDNSFVKTSTTKIEGSLSIPRWKLGAEVGYALLANNIYYDSLAVIRQNSKPMSVFSAAIHKDFALSIFHFDHNILFQYSSDDEVLPLPLLSARLKYYIQFDVKKNVMQMQIGANATMSTKWYENGYNPALGVFYNQREEQYGMCPYIDAFVNVQWKRCCVYVKYINANMGWPCNKADFFSAHHYIMPESCLRIGIFWPFYTMNEKPGHGKSSSSGSGARGGASKAGLRR